MATNHAANWPPSSAKRFLNCPYSAFIVPMYPREETEQSLKGDYWHELMEDQIRFGCVPRSADPDAADAMEDLYRYVCARIDAMAGPTQVILLIEEELLVPETGQIGTVDIGLVGFDYIEVIDEKSGYVPVGVKRNEQLLMYLLALIGKYGPRPHYRITLHQPNYDHADGALRSYDVTEDDLKDIRERIAFATGPGQRQVKAGPWCKDTFCPHRGACDAFHEYVGTELAKGWQAGEIRAVDEKTLGEALDKVDQLTGWRNDLRAEAMRRILNMGRQIAGYKVVKGRKNRSVANPLKLIANVCEKMGTDWASKMFPDVEWASSDVLRLLKAGDFTPLVKALGTPKHIEDVIKLYAREFGLPRGAWKDLYANVVGAYIRDTESGLTLERAIDGRPSHSRGSELGGLLPAPNQAVKMI